MKFNEEEVYGYPRQIKAALRPAKQLVSAVEKRLYRRGWLSPDNLTLPHFLGIGGPQSGSTWLHAQLKAHPATCMPAHEKELHFFDRNFHRLLSTYAKEFARAEDWQKRGEVTPGYSRLSVEQIEFIRKVMPDVRLVLIIRHPVDQRLSRVRRQLGKKGIKSMDDISSDALWSSIEKGDGRPGLYEPGLNSNQPSKIIRNWLSVFPKEQLLIALFDDIANNPTELLTSVFQHIGVSVPVDWSDFSVGKRVNSNPEMVLPDEMRRRLAEQLEGELSELDSVLGGLPAGWGV